MRIYKKIKWMINFGVLLSLFLFSFQAAAVEYQVPINEEKQEVTTITDEEIIQLTDEFMKLLVQEIDDNYRVIHFNTKEELQLAFDQIASKDVTSEYIDFYYEEKAHGLYIVPTETPPWFIQRNEYNVIQLNHHQVKVVQENQTDLYGSYKISYEFSFEVHDGWKITKITIT
jgi:hypothetical protein